MQSKAKQFVRSLLNLVLILSLIVAPVCASMEEAGSGIVYGGGHVFKISATKGWIFDNESGRSQGVHAVIYPVGSSWKEADTVIYSGSSIGSLSAVMAEDLKAFEDKNPQIKMTDMPSLSTRCGRKAAVRKFSGDRFGNLELVAYIETPKAVCEIVLSARNKENFEKSIPEFEAVVASNLVDPIEAASPGPSSRVFTQGWKPFHPPVITRFTGRPKVGDSHFSTHVRGELWSHSEQSKGGMGGPAPHPQGLVLGQAHRVSTDATAHDVAFKKVHKGL